MVQISTKFLNNSQRKFLMGKDPENSFLLQLKDQKFL